MSDRGGGKGLGGACEGEKEQGFHVHHLIFLLLLIIIIYCQVFHFRVLFYVLEMAELLIAYVTVMIR